MIYVIGSGLSAMAAASALVERGCRPVVLDAGLGPDCNAKDLKARLEAAEPHEWSSEDLAQLRRTGLVALNGIPRKLYFGSDFTFRDIDGAVPLELGAAAAFRSFAAGGFSNVWGAVLQEPSAKDLSDWPLPARKLAPHFDAVRSLMRDQSTRQPDPSSQAQALLADLSAGKIQLEKQGIRFGPAELAVRGPDANGQNGCRYCGLCLYGCPYDCRYSATDTLEGLIQSGSAEYVPGVVIDRLSRANGMIEIQARSLAGGDRRVFRGKSVFLAAGLMETSRIVLESLRRYDTPVPVQHSDIFTLPLLRLHAAERISSEKLHTLCQLASEIDDPKICARAIHLQFYGYNDLMLQMLKLKAGRLAPLLQPALGAIAARLLVVFGYLHSEVSSGLKLTLSSNGSARLQIEGVTNSLSRKIAGAAAKKLLRNYRHFGAIPILFQLRLDLPGGGYHSGGAFPMREAPQALETDCWGTLPQLPGLHLVDASVLPSVPASTIAFTVMANAHRIASGCPIPDAD